MPNMNRIRVNNVKYNFGTQVYDDFVMRFHGKNTIYDLANGGGKSVLMLLLLQNLIPNCTLDEKQPVEKLFRTEGGSKVIHSLVEWNLDEADIEEDYRYMLTGFCARKAKDSSDGEEGGRDTAAIDYFNYCILYRAYNSYDLVNLPLEKDGEKISYSGLRDLLKYLDHEVPELKVFVFDRKGEYQQFIGKYGLYESAWEIVRGINKTEGHVRTYFETNYRTTRKVVEDLLIEEIIEKSFRDKTEEGDLSDSMAQTLLDIRDKLVDLSEKKSEIDRYDRQKEVLSVLSRRIESLSELFSEKGKWTDELLSAYLIIRDRIEAEEKSLNALKKEVEETNEDIVVKDRTVACLKVQREESGLEPARLKDKQAREKVESVTKELIVAEEEYKNRENANDYISYAKLRKSCDQEQKTLEKAKNGTESVDRLYDYAAVKKHFLDERLKGTREKLAAALEEEKSLKVSLKSLMKEKRQLECDLAVAKSNEERVGKAVSALEKDMSYSRKKANILLLEDATPKLHETERHLHSLEKELRRLEEQVNEINATKAELNVKEHEYIALMNSNSGDSALVKKIDERIEKNQIRIDALYKAYSGDLLNETLDELLKLLSTRYKKTVSDLSKAEVNALKLQGQIYAKQSGRAISDTDTLEEIKNYILSRHGVNATLAQEYILDRDMSERAYILDKWPFAASGIVLAGEDENVLSQIMEDKNLMAMAGDMVIPVFIEDTINGLEFKGVKGMAFLHQSYEGFYNGEGFGRDADAYEDKLSSLKITIGQLQDMIKIYQEDMEAIREQKELMSLKSGGEVNVDADSDSGISAGAGLSLDSADSPKTSADYEALIADIQTKYQECDANIESINEEGIRINTERQDVLKEIDILQGIEKQYKEYLSQKEILDEFTAASNEIQKKLDETDALIDTGNNNLKSVRERKVAYEASISEGEQQWNAEYAAYDQGKRVLDLGYNEEQLDIEFMSLKAVVEKRLSNLNDKQALIDNLNKNIKQLESGLIRRGADFNALGDAYESGSLMVSSDKDLMRAADMVKRYAGAKDEALKEASVAASELSRLEGAIEHGLKSLKEQGIDYQRVNIDNAELSRVIDDELKNLAKLKKKKESLTDEFITRQKKLNRQEDFYKDVRRLKEMYHLNMTDDFKPIDMSDYDEEQLRKCQQGFEESLRKEQKARRELEDYKLNAADTLIRLNAYELAEVVKRDIVLPEDKGRFDELLISLNDMMGYIGLEQERVEQGIQDMELIKDNFENQCIRRCQDVRTELSRLPKLSTITLEDEPIQMISLNIPYLDEEEAKESMSAYIDDIVKNVDKYQDVNERMKYIRTQLSLKRMFRAIVTDMNSIKLLLYKREKIKEQSRYLRYEEAVGSTGQSQGIYIQFLISVINYIANLHSVNSDNNKLKKTIFIDNPFGAAKDIYIWEPIFEMLKVNNVQLIVPARGVTPAINSRFDVNYVLGQKMIGDKQQTVVVDYRSQVEKTEVEYKKVDFSQNTFDFL